MKLKRWLGAAGITQAEFAERVGVHPATIVKYLAGRQIPERSVMPRIVAVTAGMVTANDFYDLAPETQADQATAPAIVG